MDDMTKIEVIKDMIYVIRGKKVMFDRDLSILYGVQSRRLREQVKRNIKRFPDDFMFQLNKNEVDLMVSHFATPSKQQMGGHLPYVFTEQGVAMLSSVLKSDRAIQVNIDIIRTFTNLRNMIESHKELKHKIELMEKQYDQQFKIVFSALKELFDEPSNLKKQIGFKPNKKEE